MRFAKLTLLALLLLPLNAALFRPRLHRQAQSVGTRNRVHVNRLITESGTMELELGASINTHPGLLKYTAAGNSLLRGRTEYSVGFDYASPDGDVTLAANSLLFGQEHWNVSLGPSFTFVGRPGEGVRGGATLVTRFYHGPGSLGATVGWSKASRPGDDTPADLAAFGIGGGLRLGAAGWRSRLTLNGNVLSEHASGAGSATSTFEGLEWDVNRSLSVNLVAQQLGWRTTARENQLFLGLTLNLGRVRLH